MTGCDPAAPPIQTFEGAGWLDSRTEEIDVHAAGRPRRRYYRLTAAGVTAGRAAIEASAARRRPHPAKRLAW